MEEIESAKRMCSAGWSNVQTPHLSDGSLSLDTLTPPPPLGLNPSLNLAQLSSVSSSMLMDFFSGWK